MIGGRMGGGVERVGKRGREERESRMRKTNYVEQI